jgi:hypothetical protein
VLLTCQASKITLGRLLTAYLYILTKYMLADVRPTTVQVPNGADCAIGGSTGAKIGLRTVGLRHLDESKDLTPIKRIKIFDYANRCKTSA